MNKKIDELINRFNNGISFEIHDIDSIAGGSATEYLNEEESLLKYAIDNDFYDEIVLKDEDDYLVVDLDDSIIRFFFTEEKSKDANYILQTLIDFYKNDECYGCETETANDVESAMNDLIYYVEQYINGKAKYITDFE